MDFTQNKQRQQLEQQKQQEEEEQEDQLGMMLTLTHKQKFEQEDAAEKGELDLPQKKSERTEQETWEEASNKQLVNSNKLSETIA